MRLVLITMGIILTIFLVSSALAAFADIRVPYVSETFAALTGNSGIGVARNAFVDGPIRQEQARASFALPPSITGGGQP